MFKGIRKTWYEGGFVSAIQQLVKEVSRGDALAVQKCYFKARQDAYKYALETSMPKEEAYQELLGKVDRDTMAIYWNVIIKLKLRGGILSDVDDWLEQNDPV